jgi:hypothetical protein
MQYGYRPDQVGEAAADLGLHVAAKLAPIGEAATTRVMGLLLILMNSARQS